MLNWPDDLWSKKRSETKHLKLYQKNKVALKVWVSLSCQIIHVVIEIGEVSFFTYHPKIVAMPTTHLLLNQLLSARLEEIQNHIQKMNEVVRLNKRWCKVSVTFLHNRHPFIGILYILMRLAIVGTCPWLASQAEQTIVRSISPTDLL